MRSIAITIGALALSLAAVGAASAASDAEFIRAKHCSGLAQGLGVASPDLEAFVKTEGRTRVPTISERAEKAEVAAKRASKRADEKGKYQAELAGPCSAFSNGAKSANAG